MARTILAVFVPGGLLFMAAVALAASGLLAETAPAVLKLGPVAIWGTGILLGWRFNRSRLVFALLVLALVDRSLWFAADQPPLARELLVQAAALLIPWNFLVIFFLKERGVVGGRGWWRLGLIFLQPLGVAALALASPGELRALLELRLIEQPLASSLPLLQLPLLSFGAALLFFLIMLWRRRGPLENGFFWATVAAAAALAGDPGPSSSLYLSLAGLIFMVAVVETAHGMAFRDELTGLPARRALNEALLQLGSQYAVAMVDIDFFKKFNDKYGHEVGDQVLCMVAARLKGVTGGGRSFRYGGEEFTILFPGKSGKEVVPHLERLRESIGSNEFVLRGSNRPRRKPRNKRDLSGSRQKTAVTVSIGVASRNGLLMQPQEVVKAADQALYRAKKNGRNQVVGAGLKGSASG